MTLDFAFPSIGLDLETDGEYWHRDTEKDRRRDEYLSALGWQTVRLTEREVNQAKTECELAALIRAKLDAIDPLLMHRILRDGVRPPLVAAES